MIPDPITLLLVTFAHAFAAGGAIYLSSPSRAPFYRPFAWLFTGSLITELVRWGNREWVLSALPRPLQGWHRVPGHLEQALVLAWPAAALTVLWWAFRPQWVARRALVLPAVAMAMVWLYLVTHYPEIRGERLGEVYRHVAEGEAVVIVLLLLRWWFKPPGWPMITDRTALLLATAELARFGGALSRGHSPMMDADLDTIVYAALYVAVVIVQVWRAWGA